jgi:sulfur carrier protein
VELIVNGERQEVAANTVAALLAELELEGEFFVVAVNHAVVPRRRWGEAEIKEGDAVESLTPRQGG